jgi:hypothetical protein
MPSVASAFRYCPHLALCLPLILSGSWAGAGLAAAVSAEPVIIVTRTDCERLVEHYLADQVSVLFDENERPSVTDTVESPAAHRLVKLEDIAIDITREVQRRHGLPDDSIMMRPEAGVGTVTVKQEGMAAINGHPLSEAESHALASLCRDPGQFAP